MAAVNPGKRRGRKKNGRGSGVPSPDVRTVDLDDVARGDLRSRQVAAAVAASRLIDRNARSIVGDSLYALLLHQDFLVGKLKAGEITSEETLALNGSHQKLMKLMQVLGVDKLRDPDDCEECDGRGASPGGELCVACDGRGGV